MTMTFDVAQSGSGEQMTPERATKMLRMILVQQFPSEPERQIVLPRGDRLGCCCPYCGDSTDPRKKRGNLYLGSYYFKCYNGGCEKRINFMRMLEDFKFDHMLSDGEKSGLRLAIIENNKTSVYSRTKIQQDIRMSALMGADLKEMLVPRRLLAEKMGLTEVFDNTQMGVYLRKRCQPLGDRFMFDPKGQRLFIFNVDDSGEYVFAAQSRQFGKTNSKYLTYDISYLWSKFLKRDDAEFLKKCQELDKVSTLFGILIVDLAIPVTAFEGPMDSFLFPNSVATCSINNELPFEVDTIRWFQDNDYAGKKKAITRAQNGAKVFLWTKFLRDRGIASQKIKDYNDLVIYQYANKIDLRLNDLEDFFSTSALDIINI